jgi:hypothetical protein
VELTFAILGFVFGVIGFTAGILCMVKVSKMQKILKRKGIVQ